MKGGWQDRFPQTLVIGLAIVVAVSSLLLAQTAQEQKTGTAAAGDKTQVANAQENKHCLQSECHGNVGLRAGRDRRVIRLYVDAERFGGSVHADLGCIDCHEELDGVEQWPHATGLKRVDCGVCHDEDDESIAAYWGSRHGQKVREGDKDAPLCQDCHGSHYVLPLDHPNSAISLFNVPRMCAQCHAEGSEAERTHDIPQEQVFERYRDSIHGEGLYKKGLLGTAVCTSCHTGHNVLLHTDPRSTIHKDNIVGTCMQCHGVIEELHRKFVAGELWEREGVVPVCVECHSPHEVRKVFYDTKATADDAAADKIRKQMLRGLVGSKHDFARDDDRDVCATCHTPHLGGVPIPRLDGRGETPQLLRPYEGIEVELNGWSLLCLGCHDGTTAPDVYTSSHATTISSQLGNSRLGTRGLRSHPVGVKYAPKDEKYHPRAAVEAAGLKLPNGRIECTTCHDPHNTHGYPGMLKTSNHRSRLCLTCHRL